MASQKTGKNAHAVKGTAPSDLERAFNDWRTEVLSPLQAKRPPRSMGGDLASQGQAQDLYTPLDVPGDYLKELGFPGMPPFTRGVQPNMYRGRYWTMRQYAGFGTAAKSNARYHYLLEQGQTGLSVAFDLPTQMGRDSNHPRSKGEVGRVGVAIDSIHDMEVLLEGIPLDRVSTSMTINATASILLALYVAVAQRRGIDIAQLRGTVQNDILKEYIARGTYIYPPGPSLRIMRDMFAWCRDHVPKWNTVSISGYHMREAGCDAAQELAFTLANGITYVQTGVDAGLDPNQFATQLSFFFNGNNNFIEEVAKFRAARRMWSSMMKERFAVTSDRARALKFHVQTSGASLQAQQPLVNAVRTTIQAMAAVAGGCQSLHTNGYDEALSLPTEEAATLALRTQQVIAHESGLADVVDALGGSYAVEAQTRRLQSLAEQYLEKIDELGGMKAAIEAGYVQREIQNTAYQFQLDVEEKRKKIVGVNTFVSEQSSDIPIHTIDPQGEAEQVAAVGRCIQQREASIAKDCLAQLRTCAQGEGNLMPVILACVHAGCTVGEISDQMREVFGEYQETVTL